LIVVSLVLKVRQEDIRETASASWAAAALQNSVARAISDEKT
jgi:hypothetical protein